MKRPHFLDLPLVRGDIDHFEPSMTKQCHKDECLVENILARFQATGVCDHVNQAHPLNTDPSQIFDCVDFPSFQEAQQTIAAAKQAFDALPKELQEKSGGSPEAMAEWLQDPTNLEIAKNWGKKEESPVANFQPSPASVETPKV